MKTMWMFLDILDHNKYLTTSIHNVEDQSNDWF